MKKRRHAPSSGPQSERREANSRPDSAESAGRASPAPPAERADGTIDRFVVAVDGRGAIIACGELAPLSSSLAEIRSLVVSEARRGEGLGRRVVDELRVRAQSAGYDDLCVFAHQPAYFAHMGFSIVPHTWLPEKIVGRLPELSALPAVRTIRDGDGSRRDAGESSPTLNCMSNSADRNRDRNPDNRRRHYGAGGLQGRRRLCRHQTGHAAWPLDVMLLTAERAVARLPCSRRTRRWPRRSWCPATTSSARRDAHAPSSATAAVRMRAPAMPAWKSPARRLSSSRVSSDAAPRKCSSLPRVSSGST